MKITAGNSFFDSFKKIVQSYNPLSFYYWKDKYYSIKRSIKSLYHYFWVVTKMVPWDYGSIITMMKFQMETLSDYIDKGGHEIDETRLPKIEKMRRFIELANNHIKDDYYERCGYDHNYELIFVDYKGETDKDFTGNMSELVSTETSEQKENNRKAAELGRALAEAEWNEMIELLKYMREWWD